MKKILPSAILSLFLVFGVALVATGSMSSDNYRIQTSVISGGGGPMGSTNFRLKGTIGQSSPLMDPAAPPDSASFALYPGFWYTLELALLECWADLDEDGDVDGLDFATFVTGFVDSDYDEEDLLFFAEEFGSDECP